LRVAPPSGDPIAQGLRGFGPLGILAILVILAGNALFVPLSAVLVLLWAWRSHTPWREIGYVRPERWVRTVTAGIALGIAFKFLMKAVVMPLLGADPINQAFPEVSGILVGVARDAERMMPVVQRVVQGSAASPVYAQVRHYQDLLDPQLADDGVSR
jgi:hypothetical protein